MGNSARIMKGFKLTITTEVPLVDLLLPEQFASNEMNCSFYGCTNSESAFRVENSFFDFNNFGDVFHQDETGGNWSRYRDSEVTRRQFDSLDLMNDFINSVPNAGNRINQNSSSSRNRRK
jgi:hypothetical protein